MTMPSKRKSGKRKNKSTPSPSYTQTAVKKFKQTDPPSIDTQSESEYLDAEDEFTDSLPYLRDSQTSESGEVTTAVMSQANEPIQVLMEDQNDESLS